MSNNGRLYLTKRSNGVYYIGWFEGTRRKWKSTKCTTKSDALQYLRTFQTTRTETEQTPVLSALMTRFETMRSNSVRPSTMENYRTSVALFIEVCGDRVIDQYTIADIERFKNAQIERGVSKVSANIWLRGVKSVFGFALRHEWIAKTPFRLSLEFHLPQEIPTYMTKEDLQKLLTYVKEPVLKDLFLFASLTGLRLSEILNLTWDKVDFTKKQILVSNTDVFVTKTGRVRSVPMHDEVERILRRRQKTEGYLFCKSNGFPFLRGHVSHRFKDYVRLAGLSEKLHFHSLRHTCASWLVDAGVSLYAVQNILGHTNISTTQIYSHLSQNTLHESMNRVTI